MNTPVLFLFLLAVTGPRNETDTPSVARLDRMHVRMGKLGLGEDVISTTFVELCT